MIEEALRVTGEAEEHSVPLRLLGGLAVRVRAKGGLGPAFEREYADLNWISPRGTSAAAQRFFEAQGYAPQTRFNALYGRERLLFFDEENGRQVDVSVGSFGVCHETCLGDRLALEPLTISLAELLLTKLQINETSPHTRSTPRWSSR